VNTDRAREDAPSPADPWRAPEASRAEPQPVSTSGLALLFMGISALVGAMALLSLCLDFAFGSAKPWGVASLTSVILFAGATVGLLFQRRRAALKGGSHT
jgi:hypothetical protein